MGVSVLSIHDACATGEEGAHELETDLVHLSVLCLLGKAAALANPFAATVHEGVIYGDVWAV